MKSRTRRNKIFHANVLKRTWMTSPVPSKPASVRGVCVGVALWMTARTVASSVLAERVGATRRISCLLARKETRAIKHATCSSVASSSSPLAPLPKYRRWFNPTGENRMVVQVYRSSMDIAGYSESISSSHPREASYEAFLASGVCPYVRGAKEM